MIEKLLTAALLAVSMGSLKPDSPKRAFATASSINGTISVGCLHNDSIAPDITFALNGYTTGNISGIDQGSQYYSVADGQGDVFQSQWFFSSLGSDGTITGSLLLYFSDLDLFNVFVNNGSSYISYTNGVLDDGILDNGYNGRNYELELDWYAEVPNQAANFSFDININAPTPTIYNVTKTFNHCHNSGNTSYLVPDSFTSSTLSNPYTIYVLADDGYFFKRDGSSYSFSSGVVVSNVDYGANPGGEHLVYSSEMKITFSMPASDVSMTFTATSITLADANALYNQGYQDAKATYENTNQFAWLKNIWSGMAGFFAIQVLPNISLGFLAFAPLLVVAIIAIVRILKHD